jgi:hypothetical protein
MEQIPLEPTPKIVFDAISFAKNIDDAIDQVLKFKDIVEDEHKSVYLVKVLHKKFKIPKLQVRFKLHTDEIQKNLIKKMDIITKYAFLNCTTLLHEALSRKRVYARTALPLLALERAHITLKQIRKNDPQFWKNNEDIISHYSSITQLSSIDIPSEADSDSKASELINVATFLLYLAEHSNELITIPIALQERETLFSGLISHVDRIFYPPASEKSALYKEMCARINPVKSIS